MRFSKNLLHICYTEAEKAKGLRSGFALRPFCIWWPLADLNCGPIDYESTALTTELRGHIGQ